jgi:hypothetical protein
MRYEPASSNPTQRKCEPGTVILAAGIKTVYGSLVTMAGAYGCYNRRPISGGAVWSLHAEGRALDVGVPGPLNATGWDLACHLSAFHVALGVQRVMWDGHIWSIEQADQWRRLQPSTQQHLDHVHLEQYRAAAASSRATAASVAAILRQPISK